MPPPIPKRQHEVRHELHVEGRQYVWSGVCPACRARTTVASRTHKTQTELPATLSADCAWCGERVTLTFQPAR